MPQVERRTVRARAARLREKAAVKLTAFLDSQKGRELEVMVERNDVGRTPQFAEVKISTHDGELDPGTIMTMKIVGHDEKRLFAEPAV